MPKKKRTSSEQPVRSMAVTPMRAMIFGYVESCVMGEEEETIKTLSEFDEDKYRWVAYREIELPFVPYKGMGLDFSTHSHPLADGMSGVVQSIRWQPHFSRWLILVKLSLLFHIGTKLEHVQDVMSDWRVEICDESCFDEDGNFLAARARVP